MLIPVATALLVLGGAVWHDRIDGAHVASAFVGLWGLWYLASGFAIKTALLGGTCMLSFAFVLTIVLLMVELVPFALSELTCCRQTATRRHKWTRPGLARCSAGSRPGSHCSCPALRPFTTHRFVLCFILLCLTEFCVHIVIVTRHF